MQKLSLVLDLASIMDKPTKVSEMLEYSNSYYRQMNPREWDVPFADKDIQYVKLFELLQLTQKERDIVFVTNFFHSAYTTLHVTILTLGQRPSSGVLEELIKTFEALERLNCEYTLLNRKITSLNFKKLMESYTGTS